MTDDLLSGLIKKHSLSKNDLNNDPKEKFSGIEDDDFFNKLSNDDDLLSGLPEVNISINKNNNFSSTPILDDDDPLAGLLTKNEAKQTKEELKFENYDDPLAGLLTKNEAKKPKEELKFENDDDPLAGLLTKNEVKQPKEELKFENNDDLFSNNLKNNEEKNSSSIVNDFLNDNTISKPIKKISENKIELKIDSLKPLNKKSSNIDSSNELNKRIDEILTESVERNASDVHLAVGYPPIFRIRGEMVKGSSAPLTKLETEDLVREILSNDQFEVFNEHKEFDISYEISKHGRFRINIFKERLGNAIVARTIPSHIPTFDELELPKEILKDICSRHKGLILVTGPTGSGKSTTLSAMINYINSTRNEHILTIEDPIEFVHIPKKCKITQRELGKNTNSFSNALKSALRQDPDIIFIGELRDIESIELAITAAQTGHLVFGTLHTNDAAQAIDRIINVFPSSKQQLIITGLAESLVAVISQILLPRIDKKGRLGVLEIMISIPAISNLIRENKIYQISDIMLINKEKGMNVMDDSIFDALIQHKISIESAVFVAKDKKTMLQRYKDESQKRFVELRRGIQKKEITKEEAIERAYDKKQIKEFLSGLQ